jgi:hypothetical protein
MNLNDPTPKEEIKQRQGPGGRMLDYIDARFVMDRLDAAVGPTDWQDRYEDLPNGSVRCGIGIRYGDDWVWKWDVGDPSDIEATKGAHSDAFKRAGVKWGIGRDLYGDHPQRPAERPRTAAAPVRATQPDDDVPWPDAVPAAQQEFAGMVANPKDGHYGPTCPKHKGREWKDTKYGPKCTSKDDSTSTGWCEWKPTRKWVAEHELAPA